VEDTTTGTSEIGWVTSGSVTFKFPSLSPGETNYGKKSCFQDPNDPFVPKDNPSTTDHPNIRSRCCNVDPKYLPPGTPRLPVPGPPPGPPPAPATCDPKLHCSHMCKAYQQGKTVSKQTPCLQLDVSSILPRNNLDLNGKCLIVTISRDPTKCEIDAFVKVSPRSYALQAVAEDGFPIGGFPKLPASSGSSKSDYNSMETICTHDSDSVKVFDTVDTTRVPVECPKAGLNSGLHVSDYLDS